jgi:hypothetical protein
MGDLMRKALVFAAFTVAACHPGGVRAPVRTAASIAQASGQWRNMAAAANWRGYTTDTVPTGWTFADGTISKTRGVRDIMTRDEFGNFELELEWKIGEAGNSGIFYRGTEQYDHIYWSAPEYQVLDNIKAADNKTPLTRAAAVYGLYPAPDGHVKPVGEWNQTRIVARGNHVEHWLNGFLMEQYELLSPDWEAKVKASKFKDWPHYGRATRGHLALQGDHNGELAFRNIRVRELP